MSIYFIHKAGFEVNVSETRQQQWGVIVGVFSEEELMPITGVVNEEFNYI